MEESKESDGKGKKDRSPSFPFISLPKAIERAQAFADNHKKSAARLITVAPTWGYAAKSSGLLQTAAALKQYGLLEDSGSGQERKVQLSDLAWRILLDTRPQAKEQAIKEAAVKPKLIAEYLPQWTPSRPNDAHCVSELQLDRAFTTEAAKTFLKVFDETISFTNLNNSDNVVSSLNNEQKGAHQPIMRPQRPETMIRHPVQFQQPAAQVPIAVMFNGDTLQVSATLSDGASVDQLIRALEANKALLPKKAKVQADEGVDENEYAD